MRRASHVRPEPTGASAHRGKGPGDSEIVEGGGVELEMVTDGPKRLIPSGNALGAMGPGSSNGGVTAIFQIRPTPNRTDHVLRHLMNRRQLRVIFQTTGRFPLVAIGQFDDTVGLNDFINSDLDIEGIHRLSVDVVTNMISGVGGQEN